MKIRRMLATLLCLAMIMTSGAFTTVVGAQEVNGQTDDLTVVAEPADPVSYDIEPAGDEAAVVAESDENETDPAENEETGEAEETAEAGLEEVEAVEEQPEESLTEDETFAEDETEEPVEEAEESEEEKLGNRPSEVSDCFEDGPGELVLADGVTLITDESVLLPIGITSIPAGIFGPNDPGKNVKNVYFSDSDLQTIEENAFAGNKSLLHIDWNDAAPEIKKGAFANCTNLQYAGLQNVTTIRDNAFYTTGIRKADLSKAEWIGESAFEGCSALNNVTWGTDIRVIKKSAFRGCALATLQIGHLIALTGTKEGDEEDDDYSELGDSVFAGNTKLTNVTLPKELTIIPNGTFSGCELLNTLTLPDYDTDENALETIGQNAFVNCKALQELKFGRNVNYVGGKAFDGCTKLLTVSFYKLDGDVDIAEDAFMKRTDNKGVIKGNENKVKEYADNCAGWKYEPLHMYAIKNYSSTAGTIVANVTRAAEGTTIYLTATPKAEYTFTEVRIKSTNAPVHINTPLIAEEGKNLFDCSVAKQVYVFTMPNEDITIEASAVKVKDLMNGTLGWDFEPGSYGESSQQLLRFNKTGDKTRISVFNATTHDDIGIWNFTLASTDESVVTISKFGEITALRKGSANISLSSSTGKRIVIRVDVAQSEEIKELSFEDYFNDVINGVIKVPDAHVLEPESEFNPYDDIYIIEFDVDAVAKADHVFEPRLVAKNEDGDEFLVNASWTTADKNLVALGSAQTSLNVNKITVKKNTYGDVFVGVKVKNDDGKEVTGGFIVRIIDTAPRLKAAKVQVNVKQPAGTILQCEPVYGYELVDINPRVCTRKIVNGIPVYTDNTLGFAASCTDGVIRISASNINNMYKERQKVSHKNKLYVVGKQKRAGDEEATEFHMLLPEVEVINELPSLKSMIYSGKINLLYNKDYEDADANVAYVYFNAKNVENLQVDRKTVYADDDEEHENPILVPWIEFVTTENYNINHNVVPADDKFKNNFEVDRVMLNAQGFVYGFVVKIPDRIMKDADLKKDGNGAVVSSGYVKVKFEGYSSTVDVPITIPCAYTFPNYGLSKTRVVTSKYFKDPEYKVQIMNLTTKKQVDLYTGNDHDEPLIEDEDIINVFGVGGTTPMNFFKKPEILGPEPVLDKDDQPVLDPVTGKPLYNDFIKLSATGAPQAAKERIAVRMKYWRKPMNFDFTMSPYTSTITANCTPASLTMNLQVPSQTAKMKLGFNLADAVPTGLTDIEYKGSTKTAVAGDDLAQNAFDLLTEDGNVPAYYIEADLSGCQTELPKGTYPFAARIQLKFGDTAVPEESCPVVRFTIVLIDKMPGLSLKKSTFVLNTLYAGKGELAKSNTVASLLAKNAVYAIDLDQSDIHLQAITKTIPASWSGDPYNAETKEFTGSTGGWRNKLEFSVEDDDNGNPTVLCASLKQGVSAATFNYDYYLHGLVFTVGGDEIDAAPIKIRISGHERKEAVSLSAKGTLNQIVPDKVSPVSEKLVVPGYELVYTPTIRNLFGSIDEVKLAEIRNDGSNMPYIDDQEKYYSPHFESVADPDKNTITITLNQENIMGDPENGILPLKDGKPHELYLYYHIAEKGDADDFTKWGNMLIRITPKQTLPVLKQIGYNYKMYVGGAENTFKVGLGKTTYQSAVFADAANDTETVGLTDKIKIADSASPAIRGAFKVIDVDQGTADDPVFIKDLGNNYYLYDNNNYRIPGAYVTIELVKPSLLVGGKTYTIPLEVRYVNQAENTKGTIINYKVTVVK